MTLTSTDAQRLMAIVAAPAPRCDWEAWTDPASSMPCYTPATYRLQGMRCKHLDLLCEHHAVVVLSPVVSGRPLLGITCSCGTFTPRAELSVVRL